MNAENMVIIGAGPAGISTAIQIKRYGINPIILEKNAIGGLLKNANLVENYPGFPNGISGLELTKLFEKHLLNSEVEVHYERVLKLNFDGKIFHTKTNKRLITSKKVVIASGTTHKKISNILIPNDSKNKIFYEIHQLLKTKNKKIIIIGAGDAAFDYALNLEKDNEICILNRGEISKCIPILRERAEKSSKIKYYENTFMTKILNDSENNLLVECRTSGGISRFSGNYLIFAIGREPQLDFLSDNLKKSAKEFARKKLLYFVGDVKNEIYRQTAISVGDGIKTAMIIAENITKKK